MHPAFKSLAQLGELGNLFEPSDHARAQKPGAEHVMVEIAPGVYRSLHRETPPPAARLLAQLSSAQRVHDHVKASFAELEGRVRAQRRGQR